VVGSAEGALALAAAEGLLTRVLPEMSSQLVGPRELPGAAVPRALVRFFPCVRPLVRLQMRTLRVNLVAPHHIAPVYFPPFHRRVRPPILADVIIVNGYVFAHRRFRWRPRDGSANRHLVRTSRSRHFLSSTHIEASLSFCSARSAAVDARDLEGMSWAITFLGISGGGWTLLGGAGFRSLWGGYLGTWSTTGVFTLRSTGSIWTGGPSASGAVGDDGTPGLGAPIHRLMSERHSSMKTI
jgi:hypothetical protein